ncbi:hypothetical protein G7059_01820 [Erysipelothrix sp. HDW6A]|uniref:hypothetical protein n=1 Tax=Erysipelothrix sp. HDW6A TaxID=2714928 RepID=UPI00140BB7D3|nr:hypothetical protein [Erysipelothrix sp. HDW6A]QIK56671.1 hypothetical protein G7059_01820 [Erysipelothrix sp. HDW6A]
MKLTNDVKHSVTVENEHGDKVTFDIDISDMIQVGTITEIFGVYNEMMAIDIPEDGLKETLSAIKAIKAKMNEVNELLDEAFGAELREKAFLNSNSMFLYNDFFEKLEKEFEKAGIKVESKIKEIKKKYLVKDHKSKDTI